jgi:hypothetical protein
LGVGELLMNVYYVFLQIRVVKVLLDFSVADRRDFLKTLDQSKHLVVLSIEHLLLELIFTAQVILDLLRALL